MQLLVFDVATGAKLLDSSLPTLKKALGVSSDAPFVQFWGLSHLPPANATD
jgi:hypothetical protein